MNENILFEKIISIRRVAKVVKGGRRFSFSALIVVGNGVNKIGFGLGKAKEIPDAIKKGKEKASKNMIFINKQGNSITHKIRGEFNSGLIIIYPISKGTGVVAGITARAVFDVLGIKDVCAKSIKSKNSNNIVRAIVNGLLKLTTNSIKKLQLS